MTKIRDGLRIAGMTAGLLAVMPAAVSYAQMSLPGAFDVSDTGAATYMIPIAVPPGSAGMQPSLSLAYNSQGGNGLLGVAWSLSGLPAMTRCPRTVAQDATMGGINYDANDRFCLDGQRLVAIGGTYGADQTEYRTEREGFSKIVSYGGAGTGPAWFKVWSKSGQVMEFGNTADSRIEAQGKTTARLWAVNKISDTKGNYIAVTYAEDNANGEYRPTRIDYTGNSGAGVSPFASVRFTYATRPDTAPVYEAGSQVKTTLRLTNVQTYVDETLVHDYRVAYNLSPVTQRSRVSSLTLCDVASACLPATSLVWQDGSAALALSSSTASGFSDAAYSAASSQRYFVMDVNGDGRMDLVARGYDGTFYTYLSNGTGLVLTGSVATGFTDAAYNSQAAQRYFIMDVNGDGKMDLVARGYEGTFYVYLSNGTTFYLSGSTPSGFTNAAYPTDGSQRYFVVDINADGKVDLVARGYDGTFYSYISNGTSLVDSGGTVTGYGDSLPAHDIRYFVSDVDGDGRNDIIARDTNGWLAIYVSNGTTFTYSASVSTGYTDALAVHDQRYFAMDMNGDGRVDLVGRDPNGWFASYLANGATLTYSGSLLTGYNDALPALDERYFVTDINGDGKSDMLARDNNGNFAAYVSNGLYFAYSASTLSGYNDALPVHDRRYFIMDVNGDGRQDLVARDNNGNFAIYISDGQTLIYSSSTASGFTDAIAVKDQRYFTMDVSGDGKDDIVARGADGTFYTYLASGGAPDVLLTINSGLGAATSLTYKSLTDATIFTKSSGSAFPIVDFQNAIFIVSEIQTSDGLGGNYRSTYKYAGARVHVQGRGFLGFETVTAKDEQTLVEQVTTYLQPYPYTGLVVSRVKKLGATTLNETVNTYAQTSLGGTRSFVYLTQSVEKSWELNGSPVSQVTTTHQYDTYGNATQVVVTTPDGNSKTTSNTYSSDTLNWLLGRLTRASVTSVTP